jgi:hypothetical protein
VYRRLLLEHLYADRVLMTNRRVHNQFTYCTVRKMRLANGSWDDDRAALSGVPSAPWRLAAAPQQRLVEQPSTCGRISNLTRNSETPTWTSQTGKNGKSPAQKARQTRLCSYSDPSSHSPGGVESPEPYFRESPLPILPLPNCGATRPLSRRRLLTFSDPGKVSRPADRPVLANC